MSKDPLIAIGQVAARTGCAVSAIRFYADEGLIFAQRNAAGHRFFRRSTIRRVSFILIMQNLGYDLQQIKAALSKLPEQRTPTRRDWDALGHSINADLDKQIAYLKNLQSSLSGCIGCGCLSLTNCALYNPEDKIARKGAGPRYLLGDRARDVMDAG